MRKPSISLLAARTLAAVIPVNAEEALTISSGPKQTNLNHQLARDAKLKILTVRILSTESFITLMAGGLRQLRSANDTHEKRRCTMRTSFFIFCCKLQTSGF